MGRRKKLTPLDESVETAIREQLVATQAGTKDRYDALMLGIKFMAVKAKIQMPDEGSGFQDETDKGDEE